MKDEPKLTWSDLRREVAKRTGYSEKEVATFLQLFVDQILAGLKNDQLVRISGLGTFTLKPVADRKSVNVTTGEAMIISGYNKLSFAQDSSTKELILNATTAKRVNPVLDDATPLQKLSDQADEIVGILDELTSMDTPFSPKDDLTGAAGQTTNEVSDQTAPPVKQPTEQSKKYHPLRDGLITIAIIILLLGIAFFFVKHSIVEFADDLVEKIHSESTLSPTNGSDLTDVADQTANAVSGLTDAVRSYTEFLTTENIHEASRLTHLARKYYGEKDCWVFIYEANKDHISNPHKIRVSTPIRIPKLPKEWTDMSNPQTRQMVNEMIEQYK